MPELDETFFKAFGIAEGGFDEFRAEVTRTCSANSTPRSGTR